MKRLSHGVAIGSPAIRDFRSDPGVHLRARRPRVHGDLQHHGDHQPRPGRVRDARRNAGRLRHPLGRAAARGGRPPRHRPDHTGGNRGRSAHHPAGARALRHRPDHHHHRGVHRPARGGHADLRQGHLPPPGLLRRRIARFLRRCCRFRL
ncbi:MAG: hypothetical protein MZV64_27860 [Ignavibacteriales bacterium]|nr:hypothetical protein [Ignavibacteriales bacterium]